MGQCTTGIAHQIVEQAKLNRSKVHFITIGEKRCVVHRIEVYAGDRFLARADLSGTNALPRVCFWVAVPSHAPNIQAFARCNIHGMWTASTPIDVAGA